MSSPSLESKLSASVLTANGRRDFRRELAIGALFGKARDVYYFMSFQLSRYRQERMQDSSERVMKFEPIRAEYQSVRAWFVKIIRALPGFRDCFE